MKRLTPALWTALILTAAIHCLVAASKANAAEAMLKGNALYKDVVVYAKLGPHMTGVKGDIATSKWIAGELKIAGLESRLQTWKLRQFFIHSCALTVGGHEVETFPFWYPKTTGPAPVRAPLAVMTRDTGAGELKGRIAFVSSRNSARAAVYSRGINSIAVQAAKAGAVGLVVAVGSLSGDLPAINARQPFHQTPLPLPSVIIAIKDEARAAKAAKAGLAASLLIDGEEKPDAQAHNLVGTLRRGDRWIVVTTPTSGWFECAGERGPGVALFLALARWAGQSQSQFSYLFLGNSGHELDNIGAHHTLDKYAPSVEEVACWIHLGASISTRAWEKTPSGLKPLPKVYGHLNLVGTEDLMPILKPAFENVPGFVPRSRGRVAGELRHFMAAGYRAFGFFGGHPFFHTRYDTPATTEPAFLEPVGIALIDVIQKLEEKQR
ncbi:MAG: hypothetical protein JRI95_03995 [Deltaproteobacteria bacterium]|nr:hypothetical protein [Deltaproteobacteria bacterium]MBW2085261.1 hypothetical protein [Deltaproteobacteria bacterium]